MVRQFLDEVEQQLDEWWLVTCDVSANLGRLLRQVNHSNSLSHINRLIYAYVNRQSSTHVCVNQIFLITVRLFVHLALHVLYIFYVNKRLLRVIGVRCAPF